MFTNAVNIREAEEVGSELIEARAGGGVGVEEGFARLHAAARDGERLVAPHLDRSEGANDFVGGRLEARRSGAQSVLGLLGEGSELLGGVGREGGESLGDSRERGLGLLGGGRLDGLGG